MNSRKKNFLAELVNLPGLLSYQKDAIVSQTLIDKKAGTVTLFAYPLQNASYHDKILSPI